MILEAILIMEREMRLSGWLITNGTPISDCCVNFGSNGNEPNIGTW